MLFIPALVGAFLVSPCLGHFIMQDPLPIGSKDSDQHIDPCGGYDTDDRTNEVDWPTGGRSIYMISTHITSLWSFKAALLNDTDNWVDLGPQVYQQGYGHVCLPNAPGVEEWAGEEGVVQIIQDAAHGILYQCIAVNFVRGDATGPSDACKNSTDIEAVFTASVAPEDAPTPSLVDETASNPTPTGESSEPAEDDDSMAGERLSSMTQTGLLMLLGPAVLLVAMIAI